MISVQKGWKTEPKEIVNNSKQQGKYAQLYYSNKQTQILMKRIQRYYHFKLYLLLEKCSCHIKELDLQYLFTIEGLFLTKISSKIGA